MPHPMSLNMPVYRVTCSANGAELCMVIGDGADAAEMMERAQAVTDTVLERTHMQ
jgi:5-methylthioadenosine/S-adenosylhomocysteine deaminase